MNYLPTYIIAYYTNYRQVHKVFNYIIDYGSILIYELIYIKKLYISYIKTDF